MSTRRALLALAASVVVGATAAASASAATVTLSGPTDLHACWIENVDGASGCGLALSGVSHYQEFRGLYRFDVAGNVPATATVTSATLRLPKLGLPGGTACGLNLWGIGQGADWLSTTPTWASPDGGTTSWNGGISTWLPSTVFLESGCDSTTALFDLTDLVQDWHSGALANYGFELFKPSAYAYGTTTASGAIQLVVNYTP
ncbi:DNRLRE domain-containing protein [Solirubrobacter sp. CPCC 204708]|uniref:DNRLRE domain-containing protein n=1 Tax=Solirubrobacter deserti TaxID=2282478 RepID=A0ABT4RDC9_9ACTN|nr:DNRLRE domain-containing protein [Solirubrobacter deserti]MBE2314535.1 DNRLRE domain-containing protein [Solirubrobacter deserti]MDA0136539.1 DNRLRE domain-containing protein [Solirubrobacter deserti]